MYAEFLGLVKEAEKGEEYKAGLPTAALASTTGAIGPLLLAPEGRKMRTLGHMLGKGAIGGIAGGSAGAAIAGLGALIARKPHLAKELMPIAALLGGSAGSLAGNMKGFISGAEGREFFSNKKAQD